MNDTTLTPQSQERDLWRTHCSGAQEEGFCFCAQPVSFRNASERQLPTSAVPENHMTANKSHPSQILMHRGSQKSPLP